MQLEERDHARAFVIRQACDETRLPAEHLVDGPSAGPAHTVRPRPPLASWNTGFSAEIGRHGVTANVISPGYIADTNFFRDRLTEQTLYLNGGAFTTR